MKLGGKQKQNKLIMQPIEITKFGLYWRYASSCMLCGSNTCAAPDKIWLVKDNTKIERILLSYILQYDLRHISTIQFYNPKMKFKKGGHKKAFADRIKLDPNGRFKVKVCFGSKYLTRVYDYIALLFDGESINNIVTFNLKPKQKKLVSVAPHLTSNCPAIRKLAKTCLKTE